MSIEANDILVYHIRTAGSVRRKIIAPSSIDVSVIENSLKPAEFINECNTFLGYYEDAEFILEANE